MHRISRLLQHLAGVRAPLIVHAHCDIPCGIYDPHGAQLSALTIVRMNQLIAELPKPGPQTTPEERDTYVHKLSRYTKVKDEHAESCKHDLRVLWGDYFTPDHAKQFPEVHDLFWSAMKLASKARQEISLPVAQDLLAKTQQIAELFWKSKGAETRKQPSLQKSGGELVYPVPKAT